MCACVIYVTSHAHNLFLINIDMYSNGYVCESDCFSVRIHCSVYSAYV